MGEGMSPWGVSQPGQAPDYPRGPGLHTFGICCWKEDFLNGQKGLDG